MNDFFDIRGYEYFKREAHKLLIETLSDFFGVEVRLHFKPLSELQHYDAYARRALVNSFQGAGYHPRQVYDFVWGKHLMEAEYEDRPLSKLTKDILEQLDIYR